MKFEGVGRVMYLVYGSSSSSYMDCMVFFGDECKNLDGLEFVNPRAPTSVPTSLTSSSLDTPAVNPPSG